MGGSWVQRTTADLSAGGQRECKNQQQSQHPCVFPTTSAPVRAAVAPVQLFPPTLEEGTLQQIHCLIPPPTSPATPSSSSSSRESWQNPLWISAVKFAEKNVKFSLYLGVGILLEEIFHKSQLHVWVAPACSVSAQVS